MYLGTNLLCIPRKERAQHPLLCWSAICHVHGPGIHEWRRWIYAFQVTQLEFKRRHSKSSLTQRGWTKMLNFIKGKQSSKLFRSFPMPPSAVRKT